VNRWVSSGIFGAGLISDIFSVRAVLHKPGLDSSELAGLNTNAYTDWFDRWVLKLDPSKRAGFETYSGNIALGIYLLPVLLALDGSIRRDWLDMLGMYLETQTVAFSVYNLSPLGPNFQNKYRPLAYFNQLPDNQRNSGNVRNSFYSGHVSSATAATFFMAKVYTDYHPDLGFAKYLLYGAAAVPPLFMGYLRVKALDHFPSDVAAGFLVGALCGIVDPELHRIKNRNLSLASISTPSGGSGLCVKWGQ
jgi:membrane-associated phospholipid phosphatase